MIEFSNYVTIGDICVVGGLAAGAAWNYFGIHRKLDHLDNRQTTTENKIEKLRRGRGLILGEATSDWPNAVRRCFGFNGGRGHHTD
jgi:hypothetical protein